MAATCTTEINIYISSAKFWNILNIRCFVFQPVLKFAWHCWYEMAFRDVQDAAYVLNVWGHGPLTRYVKLRIAHVPRMPGTFSPPPPVSNPDIHHGIYVTHVPWCMPGSLTSGFLWSRWREKRSRQSRPMHNPQFCMSAKRSIASVINNEPVAIKEAPGLILQIIFRLTTSRSCI